MPIDTIAGRTLLDVLADDARVLPATTVIEYEGRTVSYGDLWTMVERAAGALAAEGVQPGDKVMLHLPNCPEYVALWFAIVRAGGVVVPCSTHFKLDEIRYQIEHSDTVVVIVSPEDEALVRDAAAAATNPRIMVCKPGALGDGTAEVNQLFAGPSLAGPEHDASPDDVAMIMYTSGTTARPKGVVLTHGNLLHYANSWASAYHYTRFDRVLHYFPLFHVNGGVAILMPAITRGATIVMLPKFSVTNFVDLVTTHDITVTALNATHVKYLLSTPPTEHDADHRCYRAHFALELEGAERRMFETRFGIRLVELYGQTESGIVTCAPVDAGWREGAGPPVPGTTIKLVDEDDIEVPAGAIGEIACQTISRHGTSPGYYKDPGETAAVKRAGWHYTGDMGYVDDDGYLYFSHRKKDMIKRSGYNIGAAEVERVLAEHEAVDEVAVVGVPDPLKQEAIVAFVVASAGSAPDPEALIAHCRLHLADYKVPSYVAVVDALPETFIGKLDKKRLRELALERFVAS